MRELFIEELESVVGGQRLPEPHTTTACCEEGFTCCWWYEKIEELIGP